MYQNLNLSSFSTGWDLSFHPSSKVHVQQRRMSAQEKRKLCNQYKIVKER